MPLVKDVEFSEEITPTINKLIELIEELQPNSVYGIQGKEMVEIRAAHEPRGFGKKISKGVFARIQPRSNGAVVLRPSIPKAQDEEYELTAESLYTVFEVIRSWHLEARPNRNPVAQKDHSGTSA